MEGIVKVIFGEDTSKDIVSLYEDVNKVMCLDLI